MTDSLKEAVERLERALPQKDDVRFHCRGTTIRPADLRLILSALKAAERPQPAPGGGEGVKASDIDWLRRQRDGGHCGEGTMERKDREAANDRVDRLVAAISRVSAPGREEIARVICGFGLDEFSPETIGPAARATWVQALAKADAIIALGASDRDALKAER
jgi:hypothetical protein